MQLKITINRQSLIYLIFLSIILNYHFDYSGYSNVYAINKISNQSLIKLPFRLLSYDFSISEFNKADNFSIKGKWGIEHKIKSFDSKSSLPTMLYDLMSTQNVDYNTELREFYFSVTNVFAELRIGKQLHAWGAVDVSSPIDILNSIDYYYLFTDTDETKIGRNSIALDLFLSDNIKIHLLAMPNHIVNKIPNNDPDFPITLPASPQSYQMLDQSELKKPIEFGGYIQTSLVNTDWIISYFSGYDRNFNLYGSNVWQNTEGSDGLTVIDTIFSYRKTDMIGLSNVSFIGDFTLRSDFAFFNTNDGDYIIENRAYKGTDVLMDTAYYYEALDTYYNYREINGFPEEPEISQYFNFHGKYYQYSIQLEYELPYNIDLVTQIFGYKSDKIKSNQIDINITNFEFSSSDLFFPGMGSSMATLAEQGLIFNFTKTFDDSIEIQSTHLLDLKDEGQLHQLKISYDIIDDMNLSLLFYKGIGNSDQYPDNLNTQDIDESLLYPFNAMEDFSHIRAQLKYFF